MPKPVYILCAESVSVDQQTNQISHFNVVEGLAIHVRDPHDAPEGSVGLAELLSVANIAVWARSTGDRETDEFQFEVRVTAPGEKKKKLARKGIFTFQKQRMRIITRMKGPPPDRSGILLFECRIRKKGTRRWLTQKYEFPIELMHIGSASGNDTSNAPRRHR